MTVLADTNILFDYFARRHPFDRDAELLLFGCAMGDYELWVSSSQITDLFYLLTHGSGNMSARHAVDTLKLLRTHVRIAALTQDDVDAALESGWDDFEDACVHAVAVRIHAKHLVTRNGTDFRASQINVTDARGFLDELERSTRISYARMEL